MNNSENLIYQVPDGKIKIDVQLEDETVWLTQNHMARLFGKAKSTINEHIQNIFKEGELEEPVVCRKFRHTTQHGAIQDKTQSQEMKYYNLDVIKAPLTYNLSQHVRMFMELRVEIRES
jgi:hypothetical protein